MKSQLAYKGFLYPILVIWLIIASLMVIENNYPVKIFQLRWIDYVMTSLVALTFIWLFSEIRRKMIFVEMDENAIVVKNLFFLNKKIDFTALNGYETRVQSMRLGNFEELIVFNDEQRIVISEFFVKNYIDLKKFISDKLPYHGGPEKDRSV